MTDREKADEIMERLEDATLFGDPLPAGYAAFQGALEMAEWKNGEFSEWLRSKDGWEGHFGLCRLAEEFEREIEANRQ